jgi:hypothetical protein
MAEPQEATRLQEKLWGELRATRARGVTWFRRAVCAFLCHIRFEHPAVWARGTCTPFCWMCGAPLKRRE